MRARTTAAAAARTNNDQFIPSTCLIITLLAIIVVTIMLLPKPGQEEATKYPVDRHHWYQDNYYKANIPEWYRVLSNQVSLSNKNTGGSSSWSSSMKIGLVDMKDVDTMTTTNDDDVVIIKFQHVSKNVTWKDLFPEWIEEPQEQEEEENDQELLILKNQENKCPDIPMPRFQDYRGLDVVLAKVPCPAPAAGKRGYMEVYRLQINLIVANLMVKSGKVRSYDEGEEEKGGIFGVFFGSCGPMIELFRCEDLIWREKEGNIWIYKPDLRRLKHKILMPVGTCQLPLPLAEPGQEEWKEFAFQETFQVRKEAYVTVLHSSEDYVCGAIVLGQSLVRSQTTKDLILLADNSITGKSLHALQLAGWKIKIVQRIRSSNAQKNAYNEYNYSKLRIWQLTEYDKIMFLDSDLLLLGNLDQFFLYPQLTAVGNCRHLFNSGVLLIEPSRCTFRDLMNKTGNIISYNGGDQGFLNEVFMWWHRFPRKLNFLKDFYNLTTTGINGGSAGGDQEYLHEYPKETLAIHYLGVKPWKCYVDYDCNWDIKENQRFASDLAHRRWWEVYEEMPEILKPFCGLTGEMEESLIKNREIAKKMNFSDGHWKIEVKDPRSSSRFI